MEATLKLDTGREIDPRAAFDQIGKWPLIRVGAKNRAYGRDYIQFDMTLDRRSRRALVQLNGSDLYNIEVGYTTRSLDWVSLYTAFDVDAENLSAVIEHAFQTAMSL